MCNMQSLSTCIRWLVATWCIFLIPSGTALASNSTFYNPAIPGFHPDPSCTFVPEWDNTFFCASSSFNAFPGIPLHASKDLQNWKLIAMLLIESISFHVWSRPIVRLGQSSAINVHGYWC
ncbi:glycoside hydrolase family 43 protein [Colletotrichum chrysophilum]|uniref:Glycoside hydrolase family 43 protein n=1 Tax=Colletotrichum chrysophilum TaxID=1836956 RepID=A0AAD9A603_9PEZI|nr:glycoside hydrolase family 43 protein [Colletotrichum chrysophilum]